MAEAHGDSMEPGDGGDSVQVVDMDGLAEDGDVVQMTGMGTSATSSRTVDFCPQSTLTNAMQAAEAKEIAAEASSEKADRVSSTSFMGSIRESIHHVRWSGANRVSTASGVNRASTASAGLARSESMASRHSSGAVAAATRTSEVQVGKSSTRSSTRSSIVSIKAKVVRVASRLSFQAYQEPPVRSHSMTSRTSEDSVFVMGVQSTDSMGRVKPGWARPLRHFFNEDSGDTWRVKIFGHGISEAATMRRLGNKVSSDSRLHEILKAMSEVKWKRMAACNTSSGRRISASKREEEDAATMLRDSSVKWSYFDIFEKDIGDINMQQSNMMIRAFSRFACYSRSAAKAISLWSIWYSMTLLFFWDILVDDPSLGRGTWPWFVMQTLDVLCDITYLVVTLSRLVTTIADISRGVEICLPERVVWKVFNMASWWIDLISCFPWTLLATIVPGFPLWLTLVKAARGWRIFESSDTWLVFQQDLNTIPLLLLVIVIGGHCLACLYYGLILSGIPPSERDDFFLTGWSFRECYWFSFRICIYLLLGEDMEDISSSGDLFDVNLMRLGYIQDLFVVFTMPVGSLCSAVVFSQVIVIVQRRSALETIHIEHENQLRQTMMSYDLPSSLQLRLIAFYSYEKIHQAHATFGTIFANLSPQLNFELRLFLYYEQVIGVPLFESCQPRVLRELVLRLDDRLFLPGDYICRYGDKGDTMYFICKGRCSVIGPDMTHVIVELGPPPLGGHFGEVAVIMGQKRTAYVRANGFCLTASLTKDHFEDIMRDNPEELRVVLSKMSSDKKQQLQELGQRQAHQRQSLNQGQLSVRQSVISVTESTSGPSSGSLSRAHTLEIPELKGDGSSDEDSEEKQDEGDEDSSSYGSFGADSSVGSLKAPPKKSPSCTSALSVASCLKSSTSERPPAMDKTDSCTTDIKRVRLIESFSCNDGEDGALIDEAAHAAAAAAAREENLRQRLSEHGDEGVVDSSFGCEAGQDMEWAISSSLQVEIEVEKPASALSRFRKVAQSVFLKQKIVNRFKVNHNVQPENRTSTSSNLSLHEGTQSDMQLGQGQRHSQGSQGSQRSRGSLELAQGQQASIGNSESPLREQLNRMRRKSAPDFLEDYVTQEDPKEKDSRQVESQPLSQALSSSATGSLTLSEDLQSKDAESDSQTLRGYLKEAQIETSKNADKQHPHPNPQEPGDASVDRQQAERSSSSTPDDEGSDAVGGLPTSAASSSAKQAWGPGFTSLGSETSGAASDKSSPARLVSPTTTASAIDEGLNPAASGTSPQNAAAKRMMRRPSLMGSAATAVPAGKRGTMPVLSEGEDGNGNNSASALLDAGGFGMSSSGVPLDMSTLDPAAAAAAATAAFAATAGGKDSNVVLQPTDDARRVKIKIASQLKALDKALGALADVQTTVSTCVRGMTSEGSRFTAVMDKISASWSLKSKALHNEDTMFRDVLEDIKFQVEAANEAVEVVLEEVRGELDDQEIDLATQAMDIVNAETKASLSAAGPKRSSAMAMTRSSLDSDFSDSDEDLNGAVSPGLAASRGSDLTVKRKSGVMPEDGGHHHRQSYNPHDGRRQSSHEGRRKSHNPDDGRRESTNPQAQEDMSHKDSKGKRRKSTNETGGGSRRKSTNDPEITSQHERRRQSANPAPSRRKSEISSLAQSDEKLAPAPGANARPKMVRSQNSLMLPPVSQELGTAQDTGNRRNSASRRASNSASSGRRMSSSNRRGSTGVLDEGSSRRSAESLERTVVF